MQSNKITVLIPTMNRPKSLKQTLDVVCGCSRLPDEIIIIDQSISDSDRDEIKSFGASLPKNIEYRYFYQDTPSLTKARNLGLYNASGDILVYMDDDVNVKEDTFNIIEGIMQDKSISMIAGLDENTNLSKRNPMGYFWGRKSFSKRKIGHVTKSIYGVFPTNLDKENVLTEWAMGYFFVVRKSLIDKWSISFDEKLISYAYAEDLDFSYNYYLHSKKEGLKCIISPKLVVEHLQSKEYRVPTQKFTYMYLIHRAYLSYKYFPNKASSRFLLGWSNLSMLLLRLVKRQAPKQFIKAQKACRKYRKLLKKGEIPTDLLI